jgi:KH domain-containing protein
MKIIPLETNPRISKNRKKLEEELNVKISLKGKEISIEGNSEDEFIAEKVLEAIDFGFPLAAALLIKIEDYLFEIINIKDYTKRKDFGTIRARIIGKDGKTLRALSELSECYFEIKDNRVGIIGLPEYIKNAQDAIISIVQGSKQANVYSYLEKHHVQPVLDLGLKEKKK